MKLLSFFIFNPWHNIPFMLPLKFFVTGKVFLAVFQAEKLTVTKFEKHSYVPPLPPQYAKNVSHSKINLYVSFP